MTPLHRYLGKFDDQPGTRWAPRYYQSLEVLNNLEVHSWGSTAAQDHQPTSCVSCPLTTRFFPDFPYFCGATGMFSGDGVRILTTGAATGVKIYACAWMCGWYALAANSTSWELAFPRGVGQMCQEVSLQAQIHTIYTPVRNFATPQTNQT